MSNNNASGVDPDNLPYPVPIQHIGDSPPPANKFEREQCVNGCRFARKVVPDTGDLALDLYLTVVRCAFLKPYFIAQPKEAKKYFNDDICRPGRLIGQCPEKR